MAELGVTRPMKQVEAMLEELDVMKRGVIQLPQFMILMERYSHVSGPPCTQLLGAQSARARLHSEVVHAGGLARRTRTRRRSSSLRPSSSLTRRAGAFSWLGRCAGRVDAGGVLLCLAAQLQRA